MKLNLQQRYGLSIIGLTFAVIIVLAGTLLFRFQKSIHLLTESTEKVTESDLLTQYRYRGAMLTEFLANDLALPLSRLNMKQIDTVLNLARKQQGVRRVQLFDLDQRIIHNGKKPIPTQNQYIHDEFAKLALEADGVQIQTSFESMDFARPVVIDKRVLGGIVVSIDLTAVREDLKNIRVQMDLISRENVRNNMFAIACLALVLGLVGFIIAMWLARNLSRPILKLGEISRQIAHGKFDVDPLEDRKDEIGDLAKEFKKMAEELKLTTVSKSYVDNIIGQMLDTMIVVGLDGTIARVNKAAAELLGYAEQEMNGLSFDGLIATESFKKNGLSNIRNGQPYLGVELEYVAKDGRKIPVQFSGAMVHESDGKAQGIVCVARDVTELKKHQKFTVIGQLAAMIAHELRNPLGAIQNAIYYLREALAQSTLFKEDANLETFMDIANKEIQRSGVIVGELLDYSREVKLAPQPTHLKTLISESHGTLKIPDNIHVLFQGEEDFPLVNVDAQKLHQVAQNLSTNAIQAMPNGGNLTITTSMETDPMHAVWIKIDFQDTGVGIAEENLKHVFDPLFTTKLKGTGLGLAICNEIVKAHGGYIKVQSKLNEGTLFTVCIPVQFSQVKAA